MQDPPDSVEVMEPEFKLKHKVRVFYNDDTSLFYQPTNLIVSSCKYGLVFICTPKCEINVIPINAILKLNTNDECRRFSCRIVDIPKPASHLNINCDNTLLSLTIRMAGSINALIYNVESFLTAEIMLVHNVNISCSEDIYVLDAGWNPAVANVYSVCRSDGSLDIYDFKINGTIEKVQLPRESDSRCFCWSPKGKQISVGSKDGKITQYKPDLKAVKVIGTPPAMGPIISLQWLSNFQFIAIYTSLATSENVLIVIDTPKTGSIVYTNYDDICYSHGNIRNKQFYLHHLLEWNTLLVGSSNSSEVGVLGVMDNRWTQLILLDSGRVELPLSTHKQQDTLPIGLVVDFTFKESSLPYLLILSNEGLLSCYAIINNKGTAGPLCYQYEAPPYSDLLFEHFESSEYIQPKRNSNINPLSIDRDLIKDSELRNSIDESVKLEPQTSQRTMTSLPTKDLQPTKTISNSTDSQLLSLFSLAGSNHKSKDDGQNLQLKLGKLIRDDCCRLESELSALMYNGRCVQSTTKSHPISVSELESSIRFTSEVTDTLKMQKAEIRILKQSVIESWGLYEDVKSKLTIYCNPTMATLIRYQPLDFACERQLDDLHYLLYYLESQLVHANRSLDEDLELFQMFCKETSSLQLPRLEIIYRTMVKHNATLQRQTYIMKDISTRLQSRLVKQTVPNLWLPAKRMESLSILNIEVFGRNHTKIRCRLLTPKKITKLKQIMDSHKLISASISKPIIKLAFSQSTTLLTTSESSTTTCPMEKRATNIYINNRTETLVPPNEHVFSNIPVDKEVYINSKQSNCFQENITNSAFVSTIPSRKHEVNFKPCTLHTDITNEIETNKSDYGTRQQSCRSNIIAQHPSKCSSHPNTRSNIHKPIYSHPTDLIHNERQNTFVDDYKMQSIQDSIKPSTTVALVRDNYNKNFQNFTSTDGTIVMPSSESTALFDMKKSTGTVSETTYSVPSFALGNFSAPLIPSYSTINKQLCNENNLTPLFKSGNMDTVVDNNFHLSGSSVKTIPNISSLATTENIMSSPTAPLVFTSNISNNPAITILESETGNEKPFNSSDKSDALINFSNISTIVKAISPNLSSSYSVAMSTTSNSLTNTSIFGLISSTRENEFHNNEALLHFTNSTESNLSKDNISFAADQQTGPQYTSLNVKNSIFGGSHSDTSLKQNLFAKSGIVESTEARNIFGNVSTTDYNSGENPLKASTASLLPDLKLYAKTISPFDLNNTISSANQFSSEVAFGKPHSSFCDGNNIGTSIGGSSGLFGSGPIFSGTPGFGLSTFGLSGKVFGATESDTSLNLQQNSTFANLANQNSMGFGNVPSDTSSTLFTGGSSFSSWR